MKQAIGYIRISNRDQSNFSISGQTEFINQFCHRKEIRNLNSFVDNGQSAKNFDRADWRRLEDFVKANYKQIDYLVVVKYDRFSRNVSEGLAMIDKLERKYSISVLSVFEEIAISPESPFFFKMRTDMLVQAEFELRVIRDRTNFGMQQAKREGRWVSKAPFGYRNIRHGKKPAIAIDEEQAPIITKIFQLYLAKIPIEEIRRQVKPIGYTGKGNSAITRVLQNPIYAGLIRLKDDLVKGIHEPIISIAEFNRVQGSFAKNTSTKLIINDDVPLRGVLHCSCGRYLTAGKSKGKTKYYWYYKCKSHLQVNLNANFIHTRLSDLMHELSLPAQHIDYLSEQTEKAIKKGLQERQGNIPALKQKQAELEKKVSSLEEKFIKNEILYPAYAKWSDAYAQENAELTNKIQKYSTLETNIWAKYRPEAEKLSTLADVFDKLSTTNKQRMLNLLFNHSLKYQLNTFITSYLLQPFDHNILILKEKGLLIISNPFDLSGETPGSSGIGSIVELFELIKDKSNDLIKTKDAISL